jgi:hypothetical protein
MDREEYMLEIEHFYRNSDYNEKQAKAVVENMYINAKLKKPAFIITLNSPFYLTYSYHFIKEMLKQINGETYWKGFKEIDWNRLKDRLNTRPTFRVEDKKLWDAVKDMVFIQVKEQIINIETIPTEFGEDQNGLIYRKNQISMSYHFQLSGIPQYLRIIKDEIEFFNVEAIHSGKSMVNSYINVFYFPELMKGGINSMACYDNIAFLCKPPAFVKINDAKQLDCNTDYALYWEGGTGKYYVRGVKFDDELFEKGFKFKTLTPNELMMVENVEQKAVLIQEYGYDFIKAHLKNLKILDTYETESKITGRKATYELFEYDFPTGTGRRMNVRLRIIQVECHTTHHKTFLGVPRIPNTEDCMSAIAWTFGMNKNEYELMYES